MFFRILVLVLCFNFINLLSQDYIIDIPNRTLFRGDTVFVPIILNAGEFRADSELLIKLNYDLRNIYINDYRVGDTYGLEVLDYKNDLNLEDNSKSEILIRGIFKNINDTLLMLSIFPLAGPDTTTNISLLEFNIDMETKEAELLNGKFILEDIVRIRITDDLGEFYPSPFEETSSADLILEKRQSVEVFVSNLEGRLVGRYPDNDKEFGVEIIGENGDNGSFIKEIGEYKLRIIPNKSKLTKGVYFLIIKLETKTFERKIIYID